MSFCKRMARPRSAASSLQWALFRELSVKEFANALREVASSMNLARAPKHPRRPKKQPPERTAYQHGKRVSTTKRIAQRSSY